MYVYRSTNRPIGVPGQNRRKRAKRIRRTGKGVELVINLQESGIDLYINIHTFLNQLSNLYL